ncbi:hypothetical protein EW146_g5591 [Bondarzewia mesenterica]|uniref:WW domain-containing protein n=1 Tax=Bondarzewia mesenterica TaxID=1095465 RepID=A0A4S4LQZ7_9AGAM|nr:hypothetical protein EW146_g5591 [Bondarzewia mesenterica]
MSPSASKSPSPSPPAASPEPVAKPVQVSADAEDVKETPEQEASTSALAASPAPQESLETVPSMSTSAPPEDAVSTSQAPSEWQAIWSPQYNAYYFFNSVTQQATWENPLQSAPASATSASPTPESSSTPEAGPSSSAAPVSSAIASMYALQEAAAAQGIDPSLAFLDPSLAGPSGSAGGSFTAKFNARTGAFARPDARDPTHLSEYERAKRMSEVYFDVWCVGARGRGEEAHRSGGGRTQAKETD